MTEPLVSVLSITYNHASYISQALESFLAQETTVPFEIVVGEDCSTDGTREIVLDYAKHYPHLIRVVTSERNVGAIGNFVRTLESCRGKYIAICEGDDYWHHRGKLQIQVEFLEGNAEYGMVHSDFDTLFVQNSSVINRWLSSTNAAFHSESNLHVLILLGQYPTATCTLCVRRELLLETVRSDPMGFSSRFPLGDLQIKTGLAYRAKVKYLPESMATYRFMEESASHSNDPALHLAWTESCAEVHDHLCALYKVDPATKDRIRDKWTHSSLEAAYRAHDKAAALRAFRKLSPGMTVTHLKSVAYLLGTWLRPVRIMHQLALSSKSAFSTRKAG
jgi:glycosyltransferase involved in cell wall biosynthesis